MSKRSLLEPIVPEARLHQSFRDLLAEPGYAPARGMIEELWQDFDDIDGNFVEQFQTTGFDARVWELYWHAYLKGAGLEVDRSHPRPDFMVGREWIKAAIEVVTVNPSEGDRSTAPLPDPVREEFDADAVAHAEQHALPIKFGSALYSKLQKRYWELPHVEGEPLVLAVQTFQDKSSLFYSFVALQTYLYGRRATLRGDTNGRVVLGSEAVTEHTSDGKTIPSGFFFQRDAEFVSAVVFSNAGSVAKFQRMGQQGRYRTARLQMYRQGARRNPDPNALHPLPFLYEVGDGTHVESWGEELMVFHNPRARYGLPLGIFSDAWQLVADARGGLRPTYPPTATFHPFASWTLTNDPPKEAPRAE